MNDPATQGIPTMYETLRRNHVSPSAERLASAVARALEGAAFTLRPQIEPLLSSVYRDGIQHGFAQGVAAEVEASRERDGRPSVDDLRKLTMVAERVLTGDEVQGLARQAALETLRSLRAELELGDKAQNHARHYGQGVPTDEEAAR